MNEQAKSGHRHHQDQQRHPPRPQGQEPQHHQGQVAVAGINAAVVGLLLAALYQPVFLSAVAGPRDLALVVLGFLALRSGRVPLLVLVVAMAALGLLIH